MIAQLVLGASGAIAALGDTLFPVDSLEEALKQDFSPQAHLLVRLRVYHPFLAIYVAVAVVTVCAYITKWKPGSKAALLALGTGLMLLAQLGIGIVNLLLLAPVALQLIHLLFADLIWISTVLMSVSAMSGQE